MPKKFGNDVKIFLQSLTCIPSLDLKLAIKKLIAILWSPNEFITGVPIISSFEPIIFIPSSNNS